MRRLTACVLPALIATACIDAAPPRPLAPATPPIPAPTADTTASSSGLATDLPTPTSGPGAYWIERGVPQWVADQISSALAGAGWTQAASPDESNFRIVLNAGAEADYLASWVYALVAPFPTIPDDVSWAAFAAYWQTNDASGLSGFEASPRIVLTANTADLLVAMLGQAAPGLPLEIVDQAQLIDRAWEVRPSLSLVPFEQLDPRWKVLAIDGQSPLDKALVVGSYPLTVSVGAIRQGGDGGQGWSLINQNQSWPVGNWTADQLTYVVMTGVTALSRAVAMQMETQSMDFPAREIMPFLASADILHTSNEASFTPECPEPDWTGEPVFCEQRDYFELLRSIGLDIVELTGNHNLDYGTDAALNSLDMYDNEGLPYFGGGRNLDDAVAPRILTGPDGTRFAFLGCNSAGPFSAWATQATPGAAPCDDWTRIQQQIAGLKMSGEADVVIVTVQYIEFDQYDPTEQQRADFEALARAGADIVSGSQAHQPQGFSFVDGHIVHFGVGNLFFDQIDLEGNRQMFADRHVFYEGRHISTVLFTGYFETIGQPRPMTPAERADFLRTIFAASGW